MPCLSDHPQQTTLPQLTPPPSPVSMLLPSFSQRPVPLLTQYIAPAWVIPQHVRAGDIELAPPRCVLWQHHVSTATVEDVRMPPRGGHYFSLSLSLSITLTPWDAGLWKERFVRMSGNVNDFLEKHKTVCELIAKDQWLQPIECLLIISDVLHIKCTKWCC